MTDLSDLLCPPAIRRSAQRAEIKLFANVLWLLNGCCFDPWEVSPSIIGSLGFVDHRVFSKWLDKISESGWATVRRVDRRWWEVAFEAAILDRSATQAKSQLLLAFCRPPKAFNENPHFMRVSLPQRLLGDDRLSAASRHFVLYSLSKGGWQSWRVEIHHERDRLEVGRRSSKAIRNYLKELSSSGYCLVDFGRGKSTVHFRKMSLYLPGHIRRNEMAHGREFVGGFLPLIETAPGAPGAPIAIETAPGAPTAPIETAPGAPGAPVLSPAAHGDSPTQLMHDKDFGQQSNEFAAPPPNDNKNPRITRIDTSQVQETKNQETMSARESAAESHISGPLRELLADPRAMERARLEQIAHLRRLMIKSSSIAENRLGYSPSDDRRLKPPAAQRMAQFAVDAGQDLCDWLEVTLESMRRPDKRFTRSPAAWLTGCLTRKGYEASSTSC